MVRRRKVERHYKLVRDKVPEKIRKNGEVPKVRTLSYMEKMNRLIDKLREESAEVHFAPDGEKRILELIDMQEVIDELLREHGVSIRYFRTLQSEKRRKLGGFRLGTFLETTRKA